MQHGVGWVGVINTMLVGCAAHPLDVFSKYLAFSQPCCPVALMGTGPLALYLHAAALAVHPGQAAVS